MGHRIIALDTAPGIAETQLHPATGLRIGHYETMLTSNADQNISAQPIGGAAGADVPDLTPPTTLTSEDFTELLIDERNRVSFPSTLCAQIIQGTPVVATVRLRVSGYDQYGMFQLETTPSVALGAVTNNFVYLSKVFSSVVKVEFQSTVLDIAADTITLGTRYDWTRTDDGSNEHKHGLNLGVALFRWTGSYAQGTANPARHKLQNYEMLPAFEALEIAIYNNTTGSSQDPFYTLPVIGRADAADWEASADKWAATTFTLGGDWDITDTVMVRLNQNSRSTGFHR